MLKYLIVPLANNSVSFCHYEFQKSSNSSWISPETLRTAIIWAMKENVMVQFVYPKQKLPENLLSLVNSVDSVSIVPFDTEDAELRASAEIVVINSWDILDQLRANDRQIYVLRTSIEDLLENKSRIVLLFTQTSRINIVITDIQVIDDSKLKRYDAFLQELIPYIVSEYKDGHELQFNLLTDRLMLKGMNNCNAGDESITLAPDGSFYICPAFYNDNNNNDNNNNDTVGDLCVGLKIKNAQLYKLSHAPICRICDAWQCKRCSWLNKKITHEVNTPSHEQCMMAHIERNVSQKLLDAFHKISPNFMEGTEIDTINYLDPFDKLLNNN